MSDLPGNVISQSAVQHDPSTLVELVRVGENGRYCKLRLHVIRADNRHLRLDLPLRNIDGLIDALLELRAEAVARFGEGSTRPREERERPWGTYAPKTNENAAIEPREEKCT